MTKKRGGAVRDGAGRGHVRVCLHVCVRGLSRGQGSSSEYTKLGVKQTSNTLFSYDALKSDVRNELEQNLKKETIVDFKSLHAVHVHKQ